ncbi:MAG: hypothetical protein ACHP78_04805 [Terriglobales bacterium]
MDLGHEAVDRILDAIRDFNMEAWGGRFNPIIPLVDGFVTEPYLTLLDVADPDILYAYGELAPPAVEHLHFRYSPTLIAGHKIRPPLDAEAYRVDLHEQASTDGYLNNILDLFPPHFRQPEPGILDLQPAQQRQLSRFFRWNIGYSRWASFAIRDHAVHRHKPGSTSDADLMKLLNSEFNCLWQIHVIGDAPLAQLAGDPWDRPFPIYFGSSPWNVVAYWNDSLFTGTTPPPHGQLHQLWLAPEVLQDSAAAKELILLIQRRGHAARQKGITLVSYDTTTNELDSLGKDFAQRVRGTLHYAGSMARQPGDVEPVSPRRPGNYLRQGGDVHYAMGTSIHLPVQPPSHLAEQKDAVWMSDLQIFDPTQDLGYVNAEPWWCLPRNPSISGLFNRYNAQRVAKTNELSFEISAANRILHFKLPTHEQLFQQLLAPEMHYRLARDCRSSLSRPPQYEIALSDKGRYFSGVLKLCGRLRDMQYLFEHPFWRSILLALSTAEPSTYVREKLISNINDNLPGIVKDPSTDVVKSWLLEQVLLAGRHLTHVKGHLTFAEIEQLHKNYISLLDEDNRQFAEPQDLKSAVSELTRNEILFHGAELRCPNCILRLWYSVAEMEKSVVCRGCQHTFPLPAEPQWAYRLNELVSAGVRYHGLMPVVRTVTRLFEDTRNSFFLTPGVDFINWYTDDERPKREHELDLAWVKDGMLGIAEVKTTTRLFSQRDYDSLGVLARIIRPNVVLISAPDGEDGGLERGKKILQERLSGTTTDVVAWGPLEFQASPRWTT